MAKAFVLHSGGIDSSTCLALAAEHVEPQNVRAISVDYGQRHHKEITAAQLVCVHYGVRHNRIKAPEQPPSMLTNPDAEVPSISYAEITGVSPTYVPFRNGQLLSYITAITVAQLAKDEEGFVYFGAHAEDAAAWAYPDCTPEFIGAMANAIYTGTYRQVRLITPLEWLMKDQIVKLGQALGVPWELTWSCYRGEQSHCGTCPTCLARAAAFVNAEVQDPTAYATNPAPILASKGLIPIDAT